MNGAGKQTKFPGQVEAARGNRAEKYYICFERKIKPSTTLTWIVLHEAEHTLAAICKTSLVLELMQFQSQ